MPERMQLASLRQLRQRITVRYHLAPLRLSETAQFIRHRLQVSGANGAPYFTNGAVWRIQRYSRGVPRLINALCDKCLLAGFVAQRKSIDFSVVGRAMRELEGDIRA